jgi:flagellar basal body rod protein FlgB
MNIFEIFNQELEKLISDENKFRLKLSSDMTELGGITFYNFAKDIEKSLKYSIQNGLVGNPIVANSQMAKMAKEMVEYKLDNEKEQMVLVIDDQIVLTRHLGDLDKVKKSIQKYMDILGI